MLPLCYAAPLRTLILGAAYSAYCIALLSLPHVFRLHVSFVDAVAFEGCLAVRALEAGRLRPTTVDVAVNRRMGVQSAQLREPTVADGANVRLLVALQKNRQHCVDVKLQRLDQEDCSFLEISDSETPNQCLTQIMRIVVRAVACCIKSPRLTQLFFSLQCTSVFSSHEHQTVICSAVCWGRVFLHLSYHW